MEFYPSSFTVSPYLVAVVDDVLVAKRELRGTSHWGRASSRH
jgi:hypothetical protein